MSIPVRVLLLFAEMSMTIRHALSRKPWRLTHLACARCTTSLLSHPAPDEYQRARRRARALGGLPPNFPFSREEAAFRFDLTDPRQAGQKQTRSIRWIGHFGILIPPL